LLLGLFIGCNNSEPNNLSYDFKVEGLSLDNVESDGRSQYYSKINSIVRDINDHPLYPSRKYYENHEDLRSYFDGVLRDDYILEDEKTLLYSNYSSYIESMVQDIPYIVQGVGPAFYEESEVSYYGQEFTTYANDNYIYYHSENDQDESVTFDVLIEDDNIKMTYFYESDTEIRFLKNDFNQGYLFVKIRQFSNNEFSYRYDFYNYQTDQRETIEYSSRHNTLRVILGDYVSGEILDYRKDNDSEIYRMTLLTNGYRDIAVKKSVINDETSYNISYNIMNITGWDYFEENKLYLNNNEVLSDYDLSMQFGYDSARINQDLINLTQENYNMIGDSVYNGPITFEDIQTALENAESIIDTYSITYTDNNEVDTIILDSNNYSLEELREFFEGLISDKYENTTSESNT
jgi:hypothetical protein